VWYESAKEVMAVVSWQVSTGIPSGHMCNIHP